MHRCKNISLKAFENKFGKENPLICIENLVVPLIKSSNKSTLHVRPHIKPKTTIRIKFVGIKLQSFNLRVRKYDLLNCSIICI